MSHADPEHPSKTVGAKLTDYYPNISAKWYALYKSLHNTPASEDLLAVILQVAERVDMLVAHLIPGPVKRFTFQPLEVINMGIYTIGDNQYQDVAVIPEDAAGLPTTDPNPVTYVSSDPTVCITGNALDASGAVVPNAVRCSAAKPPKLGSVTITVSDGTVTGAFVVNVIAGAVAQFADSAIGQPQDQT